MVINGGAIQFTDSDRENFTVEKYTDEEIKCNSEQFLKKRKKRRCVFLIILMVLVLIRCLAWKIRCVIDIALLFYFFVTIICESGDKTNIKAARRAYYIEAEVVKILPEERHMDGTLTSGSDLSIFYPIVGRDTTIGYESIYYLTQEQYDDAVIGGKVRISLKGK